jgi:hypothetical protein
VGGSGAPIGSLAEDATFGTSGSLYLQDFAGNIFQVDPATGNRTLLGTAVSSNVLGLFTTFAAVPEPTTLALIGLVGVATVGGVFYRRRLNRNELLS